MFDLMDIAKNSIIKIIGNPSRPCILSDNIFLKIKIKYDIKCCTTAHIGPSTISKMIFDFRFNHYDSIFIFYNSVAEQSYLDLYSNFIRNTSFSNYLSYYNDQTGIQVDASVTFICNEKSQENIQEIYHKYVDKNIYLIDDVQAMFIKYDVIVITNNGKSLTWYDIEYANTYVISYYGNILNSNHISNLIRQIKHNKSVYHEPKQLLHIYLESHLNVLNMCHHAIYWLDSYSCYSDIRNAILNLLILLCKKNNNAEKIVNLCRLNGSCSIILDDIYFLEK